LNDTTVESLFKTKHVLPRWEASAVYSSSGGASDSLQTSGLDE